MSSGAKTKKHFQFSTPKPRSSVISPDVALEPEPLAKPGSDAWVHQTCSWSIKYPPEFTQVSPSAASSNVGSPVVSQVTPSGVPPFLELAPAASTVSLPQSTQRVNNSSIWRDVALALCTFCSCQPCRRSVILGRNSVERSIKAKSDEKVWYRIHPENDMTWYVRREFGPHHHTTRSRRLSSEEFRESVEPTERTPLRMLTAKRKSSSLPHFMDRYLGSVDPEGFDRDAFSNDCRICFDRRSETIVLPCRHGCLCEECLRYSLFSHSVSKGGRKCPFCRKRIKTVVRICRDEGVIQYGYAIKAG
eukprot:TRINITY_DN63846_c0_g1_i1.p1 TRINITY_DN63846_c0_g1~~TRINITY_DN63846_c0_g1_i1.p1  ORF type:complete len:319 (+),score=12.38 TRINITY_DN63846_c0_g1_i1:46-957(+)